MFIPPVAADECQQCVARVFISRDVSLHRLGPDGAVISDLFHLNMFYVSQFHTSFLSLSLSLVPHSLGCRWRRAALPFNVTHPLTTASVKSLRVPNKKGDGNEHIRVDVDDDDDAV